MRFSAKDDIVSLTPLNPYDRFDNGRPRVPDALLEKMKDITVTEAWTAMRNDYHFQFAGDWVNLHPDQVMVGRALTATYVPARPDLHGVVDAVAKREDRPWRHNYMVIDEVVKGDVIVADMLGLTEEVFTGDNLVAGVIGQGGVGLVLDGGIRDAAGIYKLPINVFCRGFDPNAITDHTLISINGPTRIGRVAVLPGDVVLGSREGVIFIPPHLVEEVIASAHEARALDDWRIMRLLEGKYRARQVYGVSYGGEERVNQRGQKIPQVAPEIDHDYQEWRKENKR
jgi:regulator of RNase E activity RraA